MKRKITLLALSFLSMAQASAVINLNINTATDTVSITGSDSATIEEIFVFTGPPVGYSGLLTWTLGDATGAHSELGENQNFKDAYIGLNDTIIGESETNRVLVYEDRGLALQTFLENPNTPQAEFSGSGIVFSYAGIFTAQNENYLASLDGQLMSVHNTLDGTANGASGNSPVLIQVVPEPASIALIGLVGLMVLYRRYRS